MTLDDAQGCAGNRDSYDGDDVDYDDVWGLTVALAAAFAVAGWLVLFPAPRVGPQRRTTRLRSDALHPGVRPHPQRIRPKRSGRQRLISRADHQNRIAVNRRRSPDGTQARIPHVARRKTRRVWLPECAEGAHNEMVVRLGSSALRCKRSTSGIRADSSSHATRFTRNVV